MGTPTLLTLDDASMQLQISKRSLQRLVHERKIASVEVRPGIRRFTQAALDEYIRKHTVKAVSE